MTIDEITELGVKKACQSICRYKISAVGFDKKGKMIGTAFNLPRFDKKFGGIHAERNLISRYKGNLKTIFIARVNENGNLLPIEPCEKCLALAEKYGIKIISVNE